MPPFMSICFEHPGIQFVGVIEVSFQSRLSQDTILTNEFGYTAYASGEALRIVYSRGKLTPSQ